MDQDWDAVAKAITDRMHELGMRQRDLAAKADVGLSTVQELANNRTPRQRNAKTLRAISLALEWPSGQIEAIAQGRPATPAMSDEERLVRLERQVPSFDVAAEVREVDRLRRERGWSVTHLARRAGISDDEAGAFLRGPVPQTKAAEETLWSLKLAVLAPSSDLIDQILNRLDAVEDRLSAVERPLRRTDSGNSD